MGTIQVTQTQKALNRHHPSQERGMKNQDQYRDKNSCISPEIQSVTGKRKGRHDTADGHERKREKITPF